MDHELLVNIGLDKYNMFKNNKKIFFMRSIMAGVYLGVATMLSYTLGCLLFNSHPVLSKIAVAGSFGIGLVIINILGSELFTGNCFTTIMPVYNRRLRLFDIIPMWVICYIGNFIGIFSICFLFAKSGVNSSLLTEYIQSVMESKMVFDPSQLLIRGVLCNFIVCIASYSGIKLKNEVAKIIMLLVIVMAFVLPGFDHSIANMGTITIGFVELGSNFSFSWVPLHMLVVTSGNIIGGSILLGLPIYITNSPKAPYQTH